MSSNDLSSRLADLRERIRHHEHRSYVLDDPEISDAAFDALMRELKAIEAQHSELVAADSPTQRVGGKAEGSFAKVAHSRPMLSLDNVNSEEELREWVARVEELTAKIPDAPAVRYVCFAGRNRLDDLGNDVSAALHQHLVADGQRQTLLLSVGSSTNSALGRPSPICGSSWPGQ